MHALGVAPGLAYGVLGEVKPVGENRTCGSTATSPSRVLEPMPGRAEDVRAGG